VAVPDAGCQFFKKSRGPQFEKDASRYEVNELTGEGLVFPAFKMDAFVET
jgi:hypothetical protein